MWLIGLLLVLISDADRLVKCGLFMLGFCFCCYSCLVLFGCFGLLCWAYLFLRVCFMVGCCVMLVFDTCVWCCWVTFGLLLLIVLYCDAAYRCTVCFDVLCLNCCLLCCFAVFNCFSLMCSCACSDYYVVVFVYLLIAVVALRLVFVVGLLVLCLFDCWCLFVLFWFAVVYLWLL